MAQPATQEKLHFYMSQEQLLGRKFGHLHFTHLFCSDVSFPGRKHVVQSLSRVRLVVKPENVSVVIVTEC